MATPEEVRDSIIVNITKACPYMLNEKAVALADKIIKDEASQGVVIRRLSCFGAPPNKCGLTYFELLIEEE